MADPIPGVVTPGNLLRGGVMGRGALSEARRGWNSGDALAHETAGELLDAADALHEVLDALGFDVFYSPAGVYTVRNGWRHGKGSTLGAAMREAAARG